MATIKIIGMVNGYDFEYVTEVANIQEAHALSQEFKKYGEFLPRPRFNKESTTFDPFHGVIEKIEETKTAKGDKQMFIAHIRPDVTEGQPQKDLFAVKYMPPKSTWRVGDRVYVDKSDKGWAQLHEEAGEPPF